MTKETFLRLALFLVAAGPATGQEYSITNPTQPSSTPVHLTRPILGSVEVINVPPVQDVRIVGGKPEEPLQVQGEVGLRINGPLPVELVNPPKENQEVQVSGTVRVDDTQPVRVWVDNTWNPESPSVREFAAFTFQGRFSPTDERQRRVFRSRSGRVFYLTDLLIDSRPDAPLKVRVLAAARNVVGWVTGGGTTEIPLAVLDLRRNPSAQLGTPVPIEGDFTLEVETAGPNQGASFSAVASGYLDVRR